MRSVAKVGDEKRQVWFASGMHAGKDPYFLPSTMQVVHALIKANKTFDLLFLPGKNHGGWGDYYDRKRSDFLSAT